MGLFNKKELDRIAELEQENAQLKSHIKTQMTVEQMTAMQLTENIAAKNRACEELDQLIINSKKNYDEIVASTQSKAQELAYLNRQLTVTNDDIMMEDYGLYRPQYDFASSLGYKDKLDEIRQRQKDMIKNKQAVSVNPNWTVDGSKAKGNKMNNENTKAILRCFNGECEAAINKVKYSNVESIQSRISKSFEAINSLFSTTQVKILYDYRQLKIEELTLAFEYEQKKQEEKEILREEREKEREEKALQKEIDAKKKVIDKEISHLSNMVDELEEKSKGLTEEEKHSLQNQIMELKEKISSYEEEKEDLDYRIANAGAGYVYVISNIGAFGDDIVKIGVTRRLDPLDRIAELSSASVPFKFDIHALIFSYDAYGLESDLHKKFDANRINKVNNRKEFFKVGIDTIENELQQYKNLTIDFQKVPEAAEYRESLKM